MSFPPAEAAKPPSRLMLWLRPGLIVVVVTGVLATLYRLGRDFNARELSLAYWPLALLTAMLTLAGFAQAMAWVALLERLAQRAIPRRPALSIYCAGQLARYTPGKVALLVVRVAGAKRLKLDPRLVASSVGIEVLSWMTVGLLLGTLALAISGTGLRGVGTSLSAFSIPLAVGTLLGMLVLLLVDRRRLPRFFVSAIRADGEGPILSWRMLGYQAASWLGCVAQALLLPLAVGANLNEGWSSVGLFILAPIAGFLAMVAPGGLGVREAILSAALLPTMGPTRALAVALLARVSFVVSEVVAWLVARRFELKDPG